MSCEALRVPKVNLSIIYRLPQRASISCLLIFASHENYTKHPIHQTLLTRQYVDKTVLVFVVWKICTGKLRRKQLHLGQFLQQ